jgi:hypothetical protein
MVALEVYHAGKCHGCGLQLSETTDEKYDPNDPERDGLYTVGAGTRCQACTAIARRQEDDHKNGMPHQHAVIYQPELVMSTRRRRQRGG